MLLGLWEAAFLLKLWPPHLFPAPTTVFESLRSGFVDRGFWTATSASLNRVVMGYAIACAIGVPLGFWTAYSRLASDTLGRLFVGLQSLPSLCWLPLAVLWCGLTERAILFVIVIGSLLSIAIAVESGLRRIPGIYRMAGENLGARGLRLAIHVLLPASMPHLVAGLKQGWAFAWRGLISGEMILVTLGLGRLLVLGRDRNDISQIFAVMLLITAIGYSVDALCFRALERSLHKRWGFASL
ncbi:MAG TPA: ABC transporter permease [Candidatus Angelobacter sp.]